MHVKKNDVKFFAFFVTFYNVPNISNIRHDCRDRVRVRVQSRFRRARHECTRYFVTSTSKSPITIPTGKVRMHQVLCHDEYEYESPITIPTGKARMHQVLCHDEYEIPITPTGKARHQVLCHEQRNSTSFSFKCFFV